VAILRTRRSEIAKFGEKQPFRGGKLR